MNHIRKYFIGLDKTIFRSRINRMEEALNNAKADYKKEYNEDYDIF